MAVDVAYKSVSGNTIKNGSVVVAASPIEFVKNDDRVEPNPPSDSDLHNKLDLRFDDPTYYTA